MRQHWLRLGLLLGLLGWDAGVSLAETKRPYIAEGVGAMIQYDHAAARARALQGAMREAVEQVVLDMVDPSALAGRAQALRTRVYAKPLQYVLSYRVLWEYPDPAQKVYRVGVEADIAVAEVGRAVEALGLARRQDPRQLVIFMAERYTGQTSQTFAASGGIVAEVLRDTLQAQGLRVINLDPGRLWDGQETSALAVGKQLEAKIVLVGWAKVQPVSSEVPEGRTTYHAKVEVKALPTDSQTPITQAQGEATVGPDAGEHGAALALEQAALDMTTRLVPVLLGYRAGR